MCFKPPLPLTEAVRIRPIIPVAMPKLNAGMSYFIQTQGSDKAQVANAGRSLSPRPPAPEDLD